MRYVTLTQIAKNVNERNTKVISLAHVVLVRL